METSNTTKELTLALCQFQSAQLKAPKANNNPAFKTKYASINEVLDTVLPGMTEAGLCFVQFPDGEALTTRLMHVSGEWMQASYTLKPAANTPQASGSALTYARRYALLAVLGLGTEDDDGNAASAPAPKAAAPHYDVAALSAEAEKRFEAAKSRAELKEAFNALPLEVQHKVQHLGARAAARIDAAIAEAAGTPAP